VTTASTVDATVRAAAAEPGVRVPVQVHIDDLDLMGIVHNSRYQVLVERAMTHYWARHGWSITPAKSTFEDTFLAVREFGITFHLPIAGPGEPLVHFWIERLGGSSVVYRFRVLGEDGATVHAEGHRVQVRIDPGTMRPIRISDELRVVAESLLAPTGQAG
jgi:acyl-CoA thioester hydrolase